MHQLFSALLFILCFSVLNTSNLHAQQTHLVDFLKIEASLNPNSKAKTIKGRFVATFKVLKNTDSIFMDAANIKITDVLTKDFKITSAEKKVWFLGNFNAGEIYTAQFYYEMQPKQALYFFDDEIWTQGQGKYTSHWLPSLDDVNDKIEFDLQFVAPKNKTVISNGVLTDFTQLHQENVWRFNMEKPMSSYLAAFAIGDYAAKILSSNSGVPIKLYYKPKDSLKVETTYRYSKQIFDFLETEIGVSYPWQNYKQVPVRDFLYAGMENTTATIFSEAFLVDSIGFYDRNYINVNAHELAHQWFGNLVTAKSSEHHWLQEGFATYYALLAEKDVFGSDYYYWQLLQSAEQLKARSDEGKGESLLNAKASSLTFYQKGAWALHILREKVGDKPFKIAVKNYLEKYQFKTVTTEDFLNEVKKVSTVTISDFKQNWLQQSAFQSEDAYQSLLKSEFIKKYFEIAALRATPISVKKQQLKTALTFPNDFIGQEAIFQLIDEPFSETIPLYKVAFASNNLYVRQAIALSMQTIPIELYNEFESLLNDASYVTLEAALYQLWSQFPQKRAEFLERTKGIEGFQNKNIRQLWLALAIITEGYNISEKKAYLAELRAYTSRNYSFEIREKAFNYLSELQLWNAETLQNLAEATTHPAWRFSKYSKTLLKNLVQEKKYRSALEQITAQLSSKALKNLNSLLKQ